MVAMELARSTNGTVLEKIAGKAPMRLASFNKEDATPFLERRFEIQAEIQGSFHPIYSVYCVEAGSCHRAQRIAEKKFHKFAKN